MLWQPNVYREHWAQVDEKQLSSFAIVMHCCHAHLDFSLCLQLQHVCFLLCSSHSSWREQSLQASKATMSNSTHIHNQQQFSITLSSHINSYLLWTGYWAKSGQELLASQEACMSWLPSCSARMHALHICAITAASQAKQTICKVTEGRVCKTAICSIQSLNKQDQKIIKPTTSLGKVMKNDIIF